jgi:hypothetical protein
MRTYSPRQQAMARSAAQQNAAVVRPAATVSSDATAADLLTPYRVQQEPYYRAVADEIEL